MIELFPEGFEERETGEGLELAAYTDDGGEERLWAAFGTVSASAVPANWDERWRAFHRPVRVGPLWVGPPWEERPKDGAAVVIDPGRAFGTGGHPTTRLCLEMLLEVERGSLVEIGCGSGVIAIAAARLGFDPVVAVDHDQAAVEATARNADANGVELDLRHADALADDLPPADVVVANVSATFARELAGRLQTHDLITSGYFEPESPQLPGFAHLRRRGEDGWAADLFRAEG
jgi:ribosomal protein L11 methyltransferase